MKVRFYYLHSIMDVNEILSDSSCTSEEVEFFKEAIDKNFLSDDLFNNSSSKKNETVSQSVISLRNQNHQKVSVNPFSIRVSAGFQNYVSKHLTKILDELIDDKHIILKKKKKECIQSNCGIRLLKNSKNYINLISRSKFVKPNKPSVKFGFNERDIKRKAKEVAVTPDWVLNKEETKYWAPITKGEVEFIKVNNVNVHKKILKRLN